MPHPNHVLGLLTGYAATDIRSHIRKTADSKSSWAERRVENSDGALLRRRPAQKSRDGGWGVEPSSSDRLYPPLRAENDHSINLLFTSILVEFLFMPVRAVPA